MKSAWVYLAVVVVLGSACPEKRPEVAPTPVPAPAPPAAPAVDAGDGLDAGVADAGAPAPAEEVKVDPQCAAPISTGPTKVVTIAGRKASLEGTRLTFTEKDPDGVLSLGVLGPLNEDSGENLVNLKKYLAFFAKHKVDAVIVTGDVGEKASGIERVLTAVAAAKVPVLVTIGNRECRDDFLAGVAAAQKQSSGVVSLTAVREVRFPRLTLLSLPGYHDPAYLDCKSGCLYGHDTLVELASAAKAVTGPVAVVSHGPPKGTGPGALDATAGGNVGDEALTRALEEAHVAFGFFSNIKEAGGRATKDLQGATPVKEGESAGTLFLNPGPADSTTPWTLADGTEAVGMAAVFKLKADGTASWVGLRLPALTAAEKAEAKRLGAPPKP